MLKFVLNVILLQIVPINLLRKKYQRILDNNDSEISLVIQGIVEQNIFSNDYKGIKPSEIFINGEINNTCNNICYLKGNMNYIILKFNAQLNTRKIYLMN